jgi:uncharacterized protein
MMILAWPGALMIGLSLGMLGSGGSILTVPVLVYLVGQEEKLAIAGSLAIVGLIASAACLPYLRDKLVDWRTVILFGVPGMVGTYFGAWSAAFVSGATQLAVFAVVMLAASYFMLHPRDLDHIPKAKRSITKISFDGALVGALTGFVGVGGGFLVVPALVLLGGLSMHRAVATSLVIIALKSFAGFVKYIDVLETQQLQLDWSLIIIIAGIGITGSLIGNRWGCRMPQAKLQTGFGYFLVIMGVFILATSAPEMFA